MKIKVGVIFGGKSVEHEVSIISAIQAINNIDKEKYDVLPIYMTKENDLYAGLNLGKIENYKNIKKLLSNSNKIIIVNDNNKIKLFKYPFKKLSNNYYDYVDIILPVVHGTNVEDGALQGYLKTLNIPFAGCDVESSAICMNKYATKTILKDSGIPVLDSLVINTYDYIDDPKKVLKEIKDKYKYPIIIKPINLGSSVGINISKNDKETLKALDDGFSFAKEVLIERAITNLKEINCSVLGDKEEVTSSVCEEPIRLKEDILSYEDKYLSGSKNNSKGMASLGRKIPADIDKEKEKIIRNYAEKTFKVLGCSGVVRIDFLMDQDTNEIYVNEINTIPGSLSFYLWEASNLKYKDLLTKIIDLALKKERENKKLSYKFDTNILENFNSSNKTGKI
ncbi:MAG: D-alanine--D-alanine ligase [Bacilli bacterium]|nr:D-alanine--D-alanine ligase [Bacilli bacterium]